MSQSMLIDFSEAGLDLQRADLEAYLPNTAFMGKCALLIGVGEYGEGLQPLPAVPLDVAALAQVLQNPDIGGFDDIQQLANPT